MILLKGIVLSSVLCLNTASYADSANDSHDVTVEVPEVALIDIKDNLTIALEPPTEAGQNFVTPAAENTPFAITSNVAAGKTRILKVRGDKTLSGMDLKLFINLPNVGTGTLASLSTSDQNLLSNIGNVVQPMVSFPMGGFITYQVEPKPGTNTTLPHGNTVVNVTYTLSDDN